MRLFVEEEIHGAPVVDDAGDCVGVISSSDLLRAQEAEQNTASAETDYLREILEFSLPDWQGDLVDFQDRLAQRTAGEVMTKSFASVPPNASVAPVARCLRENKIHRVWVVDGGWSRQRRGFMPDFCSWIATRLCLSHKGGKEIARSVPEYLPASTER